MKPYMLGLYEKAMPDFLEWEKKLELTRASDFDWMEISMDETDRKLSRLSWMPSRRKELKQAIENTGMPIRTMCLSAHRKYPLGSHDAALRARSLDIMERALELSGELGVRIIQMAGYDVYYEESDESSIARFHENLGKCVEMAARYGILLGFETMETSFMDTVGKAMCAVDRNNSPYLGIYPDIGNLKNASLLYQCDVVEDIQQGKGHIFAAHLKETAPGIYRDMIFGTTGHTEYERCIQELWSQGVRMYTGEFWHQGEENYENILRDAACFLRNKIETIVSA